MTKRKKKIEYEDEDVFVRRGRAVYKGISKLLFGKVDPTEYFSKVWTFPSKTKPDKHYTVVKWKKNFKQFRKGMITCDCPAFLFQKGAISKRKCKHTKMVRRG